MFIDEVKISVKAGDGGAGCVSFRREKYIPRGGPNGGDGGNGGSVVFVAKKGESTLLKFRYNRIFKAENGHYGEGRSRHGKNGEDVVITVPCGTLIKEQSTGKILRDLTEDGQKYVATSGGRGGKGNEHFKSSKLQAPKFAQPGESRTEMELFLELKLLADVGLVGLPNAGKSTLISRLTAAKPEIADYPFTTLKPKIGVVQVEYDSFVMADMPGLIEGASKGKGLGIMFLKHIERTAVICHLIDVSNSDLEKIKHDYQTIKNELKGYNPALLEKREIILLTKIDAVPNRKFLNEIEKLFENSELEVMAVSSISGENLDKFVRRANEIVKGLRTA